VRRGYLLLGWLAGVGGGCWSGEGEVRAQGVVHAGGGGRAEVLGVVG
jgi:hypothetical protein